MARTPRVARQGHVDAVAHLSALGGMDRRTPPVPHRPTLVGSGLVPPWYRRVGPVTVILLVVAYAVLWLVARPAGVDLETILGQLAGAEAVLLLSIGLVLVSTLPWVERWFDGIDRAAIWHRRLAIVGMVMLLLHVGLASNATPSLLGPGLAGVGATGLLALVGGRFCRGGVRCCRRSCTG